MRAELKPFLTIFGTNMRAKDIRQGKNESTKAITNDLFFILYYTALFVCFILSVQKFSTY